VLRAQSGQKVIGYRAPSFSVVRTTFWALDILLEHGIEYDSSIFPVHHDRYGVPEAPRTPYCAARRRGQELWELPPVTFRIFGRNLPAAGGGYLRLFPYALTALSLRRLNAEGVPGIVYTHPWELDSGQPRLGLSPLRALRHYGNIRRTEGKLVRLLHDFDFTSCAQILETLRTPAPLEPVPA
jgi:polysaccharide deacetylase family protein (PEP-CTERM system associated)